MRCSAGTLAHVRRLRVWSAPSRHSGAEGDRGAGGTPATMQHTCAASTCDHDVVIPLTLAVNASSQREPRSTSLGQQTVNTTVRTIACPLSSVSAIPLSTRSSP